MQKSWGRERWFTFDVVAELREMQKVKKILQLAGWPTSYIALDFETYYDKEYSLTSMNAWIHRR